MKKLFVVMAACVVSACSWSANRMGEPVQGWMPYADFGAGVGTGYATVKLVQSFEDPCAGGTGYLPNRQFGRCWHQGSARIDHEAEFQDALQKLAGASLVAATVFFFYSGAKGFDYTEQNKMSVNEAQRAMMLRNDSLVAYPLKPPLGGLR